jgi:hypothetical protein
MQFAIRLSGANRKPLWSAPAERSDDGALDTPEHRAMGIQSGVALRLPPHSKKLAL